MTLTRFSKIGQALCLLFVSVTCTCVSAFGYNTNFRAGIPTATGVPYNNNPPTIDGLVNNDLGWTGAYRYVFGNGTPAHNAVFQTLKDGNKLYFSFEVPSDPTFDHDDVIVLGLSPTASPSDTYRIHIFPVFSGVGAAAGGAPRLIQFWKNSSAYTTATPSPAAYAVKATSSGTGSWYVELSLNRAAFGIPASGDIGLFVDMIPINGATGMTPEFHWPTTPQTEIGLNLEGNTPPPSAWGVAALSGVSNGVSFDWSDVTTDTPGQPNEIKLPTAANPNPSTSFRVTVHNNTKDATGADAPANGVYATFSIANFGLPGKEWRKIPTGNNPTPTANVGAANNATLTTSPWAWSSIPTVPNASGDPTQAYYLANKHQCVLVELDSNNNATFANKSGVRNMDFGTASVFSRVATISTKGYGPAPSGGNHQIDLQIIEQDLGSQKKDGITAAAGNRGRSAYQWVARGFLRTGRTITINKNTYTIVDPIGAYGFLVTHETANTSWLNVITGPGVERVNNSSYRLSVPPESAVNVVNTITAVDGPAGQVAKNCCASLSVRSGSVAVLFIGMMGVFTFLPRRKDN